MKNITYSPLNWDIVLFILRKTIPIYLPLIFLCFLSPDLSAQENITVNGSVTDNQGVPLPGVSIVQKGTTNGVTTDFDGSFSIVAPSNATLVFTYLGMLTQEILLNGRKVVDVVLQESAESLDEVVVVGFGTQS